MAASVILQEKANFTRLSRLLVDKGTEALRITLDAIHAPANLPAVLNANRATLLRLKPRVINDTQWDLLFPPSGNPPDSKTFDVTLLTILLRNLSGLPPPATGWNTMPPDTDNSIQANITRIKLFRNQVYGHVTLTKVDKTTFDHLWLKISKALVDLKIPANEIDALKTCPLGPEEEIYEQSLKEWFLKEEKSKDMLNNLTRNVNLIYDQLRQSVLQQKDDAENMKHLRQIMEQSHKELQQLWTSSSNESELPKLMSDSKKRNVYEKHPTSMDEQLLQELAKHNFKSKIKRKVKFFHPGTREWLLEKIDSWFAKDESRLLLITAGPGFGKSVFATKVCEIFEQKGKLAACHFCDFSNSNLKDPMMMLQSLASHMCQNIIGFKEKLLDQLKRPRKVCGLKDAFQIYLQNPLDDLEVERSLIVIDGLDESATDDRSDIVKLIADNFSDLPECVKVLVTSRPELSVQRLDHVEMIRIYVNDRSNELDILKYLNASLPSFAARDATSRSTQQETAGEILPMVAEKCEGSFLYAFHVQRELQKREDLDTITFREIMSFLPQGISSVYHAYFRRLERELEAIMKRKPDLFKVLEVLVAISTMEEELPLKFIARALDLPLDCRETKKIINKVNDAVSCLLYVWDDLITIFHKSVYDWLVADGYQEHEYTVKVRDGNKRLWLVCEQVFKEIKIAVCLGHELKLTNEVKHSLECGHKYLLACDMKESFSWLVDMIIVHILLNVHPKSSQYFHKIAILEKNCLLSDPTLNFQLRQRISWHVTEISYLQHHETLWRPKFDAERCFSYLETALEYSPEGCFTDDERKIAELILAKSPLCVKRISAGMKSLNPVFTNIFPSTIVAVGVSSNKRLAVVALENGTICVLSLPELIKLWQCSTECNSISCCTFAPDDTYILYGKLETIIDLDQRKEVMFFKGEVEKFESCAFSPNGKRLLTNDGSGTLKLWDVVRRSLVAVLSAAGPVDCCRFTNTGLFIVGGTTLREKDTYCVWNSITLQRVDQRKPCFNSKSGKKDGVMRSERCNRCFRKECKEFIPSEGLGIVPSMQLNRHFCYYGYFLFGRSMRKRSKLSTGMYKEVDCFFYLRKQESVRIIESVHFTTIAAWEIFIENPKIDIKIVSFVDIAALEDDHWLCSDDQKLVVFNCMPPKDNQPSLPSATSVLWCSFSPDGTRLATCTSDGFINLWNVKTSQVYQRVRSSRETFSAACWWSDKYLFVCHVTDTIPRLSRYPVGGSLKMVINKKEFMPLCSVKDAFLPFSGFLDFSECYLSFECGMTNPVKVFDVAKIGHPHPIMLPGIKPMMSVAVSSRALFVLAVGEGYFLWKRKETQSILYDVCVKFEPFKLPFPLRYRSSMFTYMPRECCFSNDSKFAVVFFSGSASYPTFLLIDLNTGIMTKNAIEHETPTFLDPAVTKMFCTDTVMIQLTPNVIEIFDLKTWKRLEFSFQRYLTEDFVLHSKFSPKGTVLAVPRLTGDVEFFELHVPKHSSDSDAQKYIKRVGGAKSSISPEPDIFENISNVKKDVKETSPEPGRCGNIPKTKSEATKTFPESSKFGNIPKIRKEFKETASDFFRFGNMLTSKKNVKDTLLGPGRFGNIPTVKRNVKEILPGPGRFGNVPKIKKNVKEILPGAGRFGNIPTIKKNVKEILPGPGRFGNIPTIKKRVMEILPGPGGFGNVPKIKKKV